MNYSKNLHRLIRYNSINNNNSNNPIHHTSQNSSRVRVCCFNSEQREQCVAELQLTDHVSSSSSSKSHPSSRTRRKQRRISYVNLLPLMVLLVWIVFLVAVVDAASPSQSKPRASSSYYARLGASRDATPEQLKKCYRRECLKHHPDKGGDEEIFKDISTAYQVLSDPEKRKVYDQFGEAGLQTSSSSSSGGPGGPTPEFFSQAFGGSSSSSNGGFPESAFSSFFYGSNAGQAPSSSTFFRQYSSSSPGGERSAMNVDLDELLRDMMMGGVNVGAGRASSFFSPETPFRPRAASSSTSSPSPVYERPVYCSLEDLYLGTTKKLKVAIGAKTQITGGRRRNYNNDGDMISKNSVQRSKMYAVQIQPGWKTGTKITFAATRDGAFPSIVFVVQEQPHPRFTRIGNDLVYQYRLGSTGSASISTRSSPMGVDDDDDDEPSTSNCRRPFSRRRVGNKGRLRRNRFLSKNGNDENEDNDETSASSASSSSSIVDAFQKNMKMVRLDIPLLDGTTWSREAPASSPWLRKGRSLTVPDLGMPIKGNITHRGNLIIQFV